MYFREMCPAPTTLNCPLKKGKTMKRNPKCPEYECHVQNVLDRMYPSGKMTSFSIANNWAYIINSAEDEYENCEGHS
jgi:hypothetical protein